jgi:apolipoprotein N-acyltransferase
MLDLKTKRHVLRYGLIFVFGVAVALPLIKYSPDPYDPISKGAFVRVRIVHPIESSYGDEVQSVSSSLESRNEGWLNQKDNDSILLKDMEESSASATPGTLIIWPEETLGNDLNLDVEKDNLQLLLPTIPKETYLLSGVRTFSKQGRFTSAVLVAPERRFVDVVHKEKLMPIGESLPLIVEPIFRWFGLFPEYIYMLSPSRESRHTMEITVGGRSIRLGILICFEEVYDIDEFDLHDVDILIGLSKNFVLGEIAQSQQEAVAKWRAVESGKTLVRASFGGRSSVILPNGEVMNSMERNVKYTDFDVPIF